jgi:hypoxanthine phosphoribosyltransferase
MIKDLAKNVEDEFSLKCIIGNSKGGCIIGGTIAAILRKDFYPVRISRRVNDEIVFKKPKILVIPQVDLSNKKVLLVDDMVVSGETIIILKRYLKRKKPREVKTLTLARHKDSFLTDFC